jgi:hypothetical protein
MKPIKERAMSVPLPHPIDVYVRQENSAEREDLAECFAAEAVVSDEGGTHAGLPAITKWRATTKRKYHHSIVPLEVIEKNSRTILKAMVHGNFPGSPVVLDFGFVLNNGKIVSLEIKS